MHAVHEIPATLAEQGVVDHEGTPGTDTSGEVDRLLHGCPRCLDRHGQHIHPTWHLVELVTGVVEDRPQPFADEVADIADRLQVTVDRGVPPTNRLDAHVTEFEHVTGRELLTPDEIMRMPADTLLLLRQGERPLWAGKVRYYDQREFAGLFDPA